MYLLWYCDNPKKSTVMRIDEAIAAYRERFHTSPNIVLMNRDELVEIKGVTTRAESYIRKFNYWVGWEDAVGRASILGASDAPPR